MLIKYGKIVFLLLILILISSVVYYFFFKNKNEQFESTTTTNNDKKFYMNKLILDVQQKIKNYDTKYFDPLVLSHYQRQHELNVFKITIRNGKTNISNLITYNKPDEYINHLKKTFILLEEKYELPNCVFLLTLDDNESNSDPNFPIFMNSSQNDNSILHPNWYFYNKERIEETNKIKWDRKIEKAVWRGSDSGRIKPFESRVFIVNTGLEDEENFDTGFCKFEKENKKKLKSKFKLKPYLSPSEQSKFKYIISTDGYGGTHGLYWALLSGSCVLNNAKYNQWFSSLFKNNDEYINYDDTEENNDLEKTVEQLINNDKRPRIIAEDAKYKADIIFNEEFVLEYFYQIIKIYAYKQNLNYDLL